MTQPATDRPYRTTCGDYGGRRVDGSPCRRPPAWGREDADEGRCKDHPPPGDARGAIVGTIGDDHGPTPPPAHLSEKAAGIWEEVVSTYVVEIEGLPLLETALTQYDRALEARQEIEETGLTWTNADSGARHVNPAVKAERDATKAFRLAWTALDLDLNPEAL